MSNETRQRRLTDKLKRKLIELDKINPLRKDGQPWMALVVEKEQIRNALEDAENARQQPSGKPKRQPCLD